MKSLFIALFLTAAVGTVSYAQCDKKVSLTSSKTEHFDSSGALKHAEDEKTVVEFDKSDITVSVTKGDGDRKMTGKVKSNVCTWKVPFKEGKTMLNITLTNDGGESRDFTVTIEGKDGKVALWAENKEEPDDKVKLDIDKFEEKN
ncbi:hypothetical protein ACPPVU_11000 [Mucilaginibacter sp. McL0603]|uniref:hypothetical protein n=1 Tax=Mucilaginibacter sp. McL0603 TaxID=3415670 RepID=UPI003CEAAAF4